jgi:hypothetical protein
MRMSCGEWDVTNNPIQSPLFHFMLEGGLLGAGPLLRGHHFFTCCLT